MPTRIGRISANEYHTIDPFTGTDITYKVIETPCTDGNTNVTLIEDASYRDQPEWSWSEWSWSVYARFIVNGDEIDAVYSDCYDSGYQFFKSCVGKTVIFIKKEKQEIPNEC